MYWSLPTLDPAIERVWMGDDVVVPGIGHRTDPVLGADLVFTIVDGACTVRLQGLVTRRHTYPHVRGAQYVGVRFQPGASESTIGPHLRDLTNDATDLTRFGGVELGPVVDAVLGAETLEERGSVVRDMLSAYPGARHAPDALVTETLARFAASATRVSEVAGELGVSERSLQRRFARHVGITPKHAARLVRVGNLTQAIEVCRDPDLAFMATACGFFDQAHMTNEVRRVLGTTPAALVEECLRGRTAASRDR